MTTTKEQIKERKAQYYQDNKEQINKQKTQYRQDNKEQISEQRKQHYRDNKERINEQQTQYRQEHRNEKMKYNEQYRQEHPEFSFLGKKFPLLKHEAAPEGYLWHHLVYDHADPESCMVLMKKGAHTTLHNTFRHAGVKIPHINMEK